jgi:hypothetical protein
VTGIDTRDTDLDPTLLKKEVEGINIQGSTILAEEAGQGQIDTKIGVIGGETGLEKVKTWTRRS